MAARKKKPSAVREPIQVYLDTQERRQLDALARQLDVSRAEVLRRGLDALRKQKPKDPYEAFAPLIGAFDDPDGPTDGSTNFRKHYVDYLEKKWKRGPKSS